MNILKNKPINWWYFFFWSGIVVPGIFFILTHLPFVLGHFRGFVIQGANPYVNAVFNLSIFLLITIIFKLIAKLRINSKVRFFLYSLFGSIFILFFIKHFLPYKIKSENFPRRYVDYFDKSILIEKNVSINSYFYYGSLIIILVIFLFFFIRNFPVFKKKNND